jgi:hypothetical protein
MYEHLTTWAEKKRADHCPWAGLHQYVHTGFGNIKSVLKIGLLDLQHAERFRLSALAPEITEIQKVVCRTVVFGRLVSTVLSRRVVVIWITTPYHLRKLIFTGQVTWIPSSLNAFTYLHPQVPSHSMFGSSLGNCQLIYKERRAATKGEWSTEPWFHYT